MLMLIVDGFMGLVLFVFLSERQSIGHGAPKIESEHVFSNFDKYHKVCAGI